MKTNALILKGSCSGMVCGDHGMRVETQVNCGQRFDFLLFCYTLF